MKTRAIIALALLISIQLSIYADVYPYPWKDLETYQRFEKEQLVINDNLISDKYTVRVRDLTNNSDWIDITTLSMHPRIHQEHPITGGNAVTSFQSDRSMSFAPFAFTNEIEVEVTKLFGSKANRIVVSPKACNLNPHYFDGKKVRFVMRKWGYISINFVCADNQDDNRNGGMDIKHGMMIFADYPEEVTNDYAIPNQTDKGVVVWNNQTDIETLREADILYFPPGVHQMKRHKDNTQVYLTDAEAMKAAPLYHGQLRFRKTQKIYIAPGAYVLGCFNNRGYPDCYIYGRGVISGRDHYMHEILIPKIVDGKWILETATKEAFISMAGNRSQMHGVVMTEAYHHTCPSGPESKIKHIKILGYSSNNDGVRPGENSLVDGIFIKTSDDYDYARSLHTVRNSYFWPGVNGSIGQLGWNNLGNGYAQYYDNFLFNSEWSSEGKGNSGMIGSKASSGIKLTDNRIENLYIEDPTNYLVIAQIGEGETSMNPPAGYFKDFVFKNIKVEYPFCLPSEIDKPIKQVMKGCPNNFLTGWKYTNLIVDGCLVTWDNHKQYFDLELTGTNGNNEDAKKYVSNITFDSEGTIHNISIRINGAGTVRPRGHESVIDCPSESNQTVSFLPDEGNRIKDVKIDGVSRGAIQCYTFHKIKANHSIEVSFEPGDNYLNTPPVTSQRQKVNVSVKSKDGELVSGIKLVTDYQYKISSADKVVEFELYPGEYPLYAYHGDTQIAELRLVVGEENLDVELHVNIASYTGIPWNKAPFSFGSDNSANFNPTNRIQGWMYDIGSVLLPSTGENSVPADAFTGNYNVVAACLQTKVQSSTPYDIRKEKAEEMGITLDGTDNTAREQYGTLIWKSDRSTFDQGGAGTRYTCRFDEGKYRIIARAYGSSNNNFAYSFTIRRKDNFQIVFQESMHNKTDIQNGVIVADKNGVTDEKYNLLGATEATNITWCLYNKEIDIEQSGEYIIEYTHPRTPALGGVLGEITFEHIPSDPVGIERTSRSKDSPEAFIDTENRLHVTDGEEVSIYNLVGQKLSITKIEGSSILPLHLQPGIYIVQIRQGEVMKSLKITVRK